MRRLAVAAVAAVALALPGTASAAVSLTEFVHLDDPGTYLTSPPGDGHRVFITLQSGQILLVRDGGAPTSFLTVPNMVTSGERGLFSMAFAPDYAASGHFYVFYTAAYGGNPDDPGVELKVDEFRRSAANPDVADPATQRNVMTIDHPNSSSHDGGQLQFGPDGHLYISVGDGGGAGDPLNNGQSTGTWLGKILRIDPRRSGALAYTVPADNPFVGVAGAKPEIWAYGLRNPWRFSFDRQTGDMTIGDVGYDSYEEVDYTPKGSALGLDYGWHCKEGMHDTPGVPACTPSGTYEPPILEWEHLAQRCSGAVTGGYVVHDPDLPSLAGRYLYGDFCQDRLNSLVPAKPAATDDKPLGPTVHRLTSFGEDSCGHVYLVAVRDVYRVSGDRFTPCAPAHKPADHGEQPPPADKRAPELRVDGLALKHKGVYLRVGCDERCGAVVTGALAVPGTHHRFRPHPVVRELEPGSAAKLALRLGHRGRHAVKRALATGKRVRVSLKAVATDAAGNRTVVHRRARLGG